LFIADSVNRRDYFFDLGKDPKRMRCLLTLALRNEYEKLIRGGLQTLNNFYDPGYAPMHVASHQRSR